MEHLDSYNGYDIMEVLMIIGYHYLLKSHACSSIGANVFDMLITINLTLMLFKKVLQLLKMPFCK
jgi:hypothetical protein